MNKVLVIGGASFVGACLVRRLVARGDDVHLILAPDENTWRLRTLLLDIGVHSFDWCDRLLLERCLRQVAPDIIVNCASYFREWGPVNHDSLVSVNLTGVLNLLAILKKIGFECFINTGSFQEYSRTQLCKGLEAEGVPLTDFGVIKRAATLLCERSSQAGLPVYTARLFSVYGPYQSVHHELTRLFEPESSAREFSRHMMGIERDYTYIDDVIELYLAIMTYKPKHRFVFDAASGVTWPLSSALDQASRLFSPSLQSKTAPSIPVSASLSQGGGIKEIGWAPTTDFLTGLEKTYRWFLEHRSWYQAERQVAGEALGEAW